MRATASMPLPAASGTTMVMLRLGKSWALAGAHARAAVRAHTKARSQSWDIVAFLPDGPPRRPLPVTHEPLLSFTSVAR
jgi:hypothetical protein